jgi:hypothetical protein
MLFSFCWTITAVGQVAGGNWIRRAARPVSCSILPFLVVNFNSQKRQSTLSSDILTALFDNLRATTKLLLAKWRSLWSATLRVALNTLVAGLGL